jgi:16S rRNA (uracil1498-N3)-methyltransferase
VRLTRIFQLGPLRAGQPFVLSEEAAHHVAIVLRMQPSEELILFCGDNREYRAKIMEVHKRKVIVSIQSDTLVNRESPCCIHLAQALAKGERMEWVIQKAVELGVNTITPLITQRSVVRLDEERLLKKQSQWQAIATAACEQSGRNVLPTVLPAVSLERYAAHCEAELKIMLHPEATITWKTLPSNVLSIALLIGPEGGFTEDEVRLVAEHHFQAIALGPRILRTETAAITALSILQAMRGDL